MFQQHSNTFTPIRSTVGRAVPYRMDVQHSSIAVEQHGLVTEIKNRTAIEEAATDTELLRFWPEIRNETRLGGNITYRADPNQPLLIVPDPVRPPFPQNAPHKSIFALAKKNSDDDAQSRELSVTFRISLPAGPHLIGGIAFSGYPALGHSIDKFGRTSSNYGLPREMRISIASLQQGARTHESKFIDADLHYTNQVINHSSGFHFFHVEPTLTAGFTLQLSDFPLLMKRVLLGASDSVKYTQAFGLVIPYLYVYTYQEKSHYHHYVPGGVVGAVMSDDSVTASGLRQEHLSPDWQRLITPRGAEKGNYQLFPASSIFRPGRRYTASTPAYFYEHSAQEQFVSDPLANGESISIICQQCDESLRSIAGIELLIPVFDPEKSRGTEGKLEQQIGLPEREVDLLDKVGIKIYELDFPTGVSPLDARKDVLRKYKHLLAEKILTRDDTLSTLELDGAQAPPDQRSLRFKRASNHRYFEIELINLGDKPGNAVVLSAMFIQSAHITLHPKLSRRLQVSRMHFRIVGHDLAEDYAQIGTHGFNFSIERLSGGQPIQQILAIRSLSDLIQSGMARIMSNSRRRAVEFEKSEVYEYTEEDGPRVSPYATAFPEEANRQNYESRYTQNKSEGWSKIESGEGVQFGDKSAESYSSQEVRTHTEHLYPYTNGLEADPDVIAGGAVVPTADIASAYEAAAIYLNVGHGLFTDAPGTIVGWVLGDNSLLIPAPVKDNNNQSVNPLDYNFDYWTGIKVVPKVGGLRQVSVSPFSPVPIGYDAVQSAFTSASNALRVINDIAMALNSLPGQDAPPPDLATIWRAVRSALSAFQVASTAFLAPATIGVGGSGAAGALFNAGNGLGIGASVGFIGGVSTSSNLLTPSMIYNHTFGSQGTITKTASKTGYMKSETVRETIDAGKTDTLIQGGENKRIVERRAVPDTDQKRIKGAEIMWQGELKDIILGTVPLDISFPALAERGATSFDEALRVRFGNGIGDDIEVDFWFEINESEIRDDF